MTSRRQAVKRDRPTGKLDWTAPVAGWKSDVPLIDMPPTAAAQLDNFFPEENWVRGRYGSANWATGATGAVKTVIPYNGATNKLFAANSGGIYDVTTKGATFTAPVVSGFTNDYWSYAQLTTAGGYFLQICNGVDTPQTYDGTSWTNSGWTGGPSPLSLLSVVHLYRSRLWFVQAGSSVIWYGTTDGETGALTSLNIGDVLTHGGSLVAIGTWTIPFLGSIIENIVFISDQGEAVIYQGSDPSNSSNWSLLGTFMLGPPLGADRCLFNTGADLAVSTVYGVLPISQAVTLDPAASSQISLTKPILPSFLTEVQACASSPGWQLISFPLHHMIILNVPDPQQTMQFVMNAETKAWCRFLGWPVYHFAIWEAQLYAGTTDGRVILCETGGNDNGASIVCQMTGAFSRQKDGFAWKVAGLIGGSYEASAGVQIGFGVSADYIPKTSVPTPSGAAGGLATWGTAIWGTSVWPGFSNVFRWSDGGAQGRALAPTVSAVVNGSTTEVRVLGGTIVFTSGETL